jgi:hypothetical protein
MEGLSVAPSRVDLLKAEAEVVGSYRRTEVVEAAAAAVVVVEDHLPAEVEVAEYPSFA